MRKIVLLVSIFFVLSLSNVHAITEIDSCHNLDTPYETFVLTKNVTATGSWCFVIRTDNVILDCQNNYIIGNATSGYIADLIQIWSSNVTIKNCVFTSTNGNSYGVSLLYDGSIGNTITNNTFHNHLHGVDFSNGASNNLIIDNKFNSNNIGVASGGEWNNNNIIANNTLDFGGGGIWLSYRDSGNTIENNTIRNSYSLGIELSGTDNLISDNRIINVKENSGIRVHCGNNTITNNIIDSANYGITLFAEYCYNVTNVTITNNVITNSTLYGIYFFNQNSVVMNNLIYNNLLNNTVNWYSFTFYLPTQPNYWNTTKTLGTNIIGDPYVGGNYWTNKTNNGYSNTCTDADSDGFCDDPYILDSNNIDYLPIALYIPSTTTTTTTSTTTTIGPLIYINSCGELSIPEKTYILTQDISGANCLGITANNVTLDCDNHKISGCGGTGNRGIYSNSPNATIKNCILEGCYEGIQLNNSDNSIVENVISNNHYYCGIRLRYSNKVNLKNVTASHSDFMGYGMLFYYSIDNILNDVTIDNNWVGINMYWETWGNKLTNVKIKNNYGTGILMRYFGLNELDNVIITNNGGAGIGLLSSDHNVIKNSVIQDNGFGIDIASMWEPEDNLFYNNIFNNTNNIRFSSTIYSYKNFWNTSKISGMNIIGDPYIGGNYWTNSAGNGYSDTCADTNYDGFCDASYQLNEKNIDYLPLTKIKDSDGDGVPNSEDKCPNTVGQQLVYGCSCEQILKLKPGEDTATNREGCSKGIIEVFTKGIGWAKDLFG